MHGFVLLFGGTNILKNYFYFVHLIKENRLKTNIMGF